MNGAKKLRFASAPATRRAILSYPKIAPTAMIRQLRFLLLFPVTLFGNCPADAQSLVHLPGQLLVSLVPGSRPEKLVQRGSNHLSAPIFVQKKVATLLNIWQLQTTAEARAELAALDWLRRQPEVRAAQFNHQLQQRLGSTNSTVPNDPLFTEQWHLLNTGANAGMFDADLDAEQAWDLTTGGLSAAGDTLVIAVIDGGVDFQHPDLGPNAWNNWADRPNDGLDNDQNGFTDDFRGWNVDAQNDDVAGQTTGHGTPVCGLLGARGDNGMGVAGVNWRIKIMFVASGGSEASVLAAYDYVWKARQLYNSTDGQQGAFVTAINCSWGINYGQPADAPLWCSAFDTLGAAGILSVAATANLAVDVDLVGDLPTACPSDYLITVTSLQRNDQKALLAAWGAQHIDLGAYGQEVFTLGPGNTYGNFSGTSYAAPQVTGAIALLYSMPCANLIAVAKSDPSAAARWVKELLLDSTTPNLSLAGLTGTGGRLNLFNLLQNYSDLCNPCPAPFSLSAETQDSSITLTWTHINDYQYFNIMYRPFNQIGWIGEEQVSSPFILPALVPCQPYVFSLQAYCLTGQASPWSDPVNFATAGCCAPPGTITVQSATATSLNLVWTDNAVGSGELRYRIVGSAADWQVLETSDNQASLTGLHACASYEVQVRSQCKGAFTPFSALFKVTTAGCGACSDLTYCAANAAQSSDEWIAAVTIHDWLQISGTGGGGYQNFTGDQAVILELHPSTAPVVAVTPGFYSTPGKAYFRIYVDFNADGDFEDADELAFDPGFAHDATMNGYLQVPAFTTSGYTRMRILMKAKNATNHPPSACESFDFGQIEDYCVLLSPTIDAAETAVETAGQLHISPQPVRSVVRLEWPADHSENIRLQVWNTTGQLVFSRLVTDTSSSLVMDISAWQSGAYLVHVQTGKKRWQARLLKL